eukprot:GHVS01057458.1.p1 GENE.GHVS01057458.1~~GHVS01057458.1.p1  ORF type:complete len:542 (+),score=69.29 GHVS01057458.1:323-1948(+)
MYDGQPDANILDLFESSVKRLLESKGVELNGDDAVRQAGSYLTANVWWRYWKDVSTKKAHLIRGIDDMMLLLREEFLPNNFLEKKMEELLEIKMNPKGAREYNERFRYLIRVTNNQLMGEGWKRYFFEKGLTAHVRRMLRSSPAVINNLDDLMEVTQQIDDEAYGLASGSSSACSAAHSQHSRCSDASVSTNSSSHDNNNQAKGERGGGGGGEYGEGTTSLNSTNVECYNCGKRGHLSRDCYGRPKSIVRRRTEDHPQPCLSEPREEHKSSMPSTSPPPPPLPPVRDESASNSNYGKLPIIPIRLEGILTGALVATGTDISSIQLKFVKKHGLTTRPHRQSLSICYRDMSVEAVKAEGVYAFEIGGLKMREKLLVADTSVAVPVILGSDWIDKWRTSLTFCPVVSVGLRPLGDRGNWRYVKAYSNFEGMYDSVNGKRVDYCLGYYCFRDVDTNQQTDHSPPVSTTLHGLNTSKKQKEQKALPELTRKILDKYPELVRTGFLSDGAPPPPPTPRQGKAEHTVKITEGAYSPAANRARRWRGE